MTDRVLAADIRLLQEEKNYERALSLLPAFRLEKLMRFRQYPDRVRGAGAFLLLALALRPLGMKPSDIIFSQGRHGKPSLAGVDDVHFNLSHSGDMVMCIVSDVSCGCDVQDYLLPGPVSGSNDNTASRIRHGVQNIDSISSRFFHEKEQEFLRRSAAECGESGRLRDFYRIWALKESCIKASGLGMYMELKGFFALPDPEGTSCEGCFTREYSFSSAGAASEQTIAYAFAACCKGKNPPKIMEQVATVDLILNY